MLSRPLIFLRHPWRGEGSCLRQDALRSSIARFVERMRSSFLALVQLLICFSRVIASLGLSYSSKCTSWRTRYSLVKPFVNPSRCSFTLRSKSLVTPMYRTPDLLLMMYKKKVLFSLSKRAIRGGSRRSKQSREFYCWAAVHYYCQASFLGAVGCGEIYYA